jgi:antitoxin (DNA-binding transcriptional repressor) of toxin-antitoxin stability system
MTITMTQFRREIESLLRRAQRGEEFVITQWGRPVARLLRPQPEDLEYYEKFLRPGSRARRRPKRRQD